MFSLQQYLFLFLALGISAYVLRRNYSPKACYQLAMLHALILVLILVYGFVLMVITSMGDSEMTRHIRQGVWCFYALGPGTLALTRILISLKRPVAAARISALFLASIFLAVAFFIVMPR